MDRALCEPDLVEQCERAIAEIRIADAGRSELRHAVERIELHYSICLSASAGRRRAARSAPAAPAIKPPRSARAKPVASTPAPTGALSDTAFVAVRMVPAPRSEDPPPVLALAVSVGPNASIASAARTPSTMPSTPPTAPWARDSPAI